MPMFVCLENDGKFVYVIVIHFNFFNVGYDLVRHEYLSWNKLLVYTTFGTDTNVVVTSTDSGHIYRNVILSSLLELIKLLS